jgi:hypothetical protein
MLTPGLGTILKNILQFTGLVVGTPVSLPHKLNVNGVALVPQVVAANQSGFTVTANATNVTVTMTADATTNNVNILCELWHSIEDVEPPGGLSALFPFVINGSGSGGGGGGGSGGIYTATGLEGTSFPVTFAALGITPPASYVAIVQVNAAAGFIVATTPPSSWTGSQITVNIGSALAAADTVTVIIVPT